MVDVPAPTHREVLAVLAALGQEVGASAEAFLDSRPSARAVVARVVEHLRTDDRGRDHPALATAARWLRNGRGHEDAVATARLAAAVVRLLRAVGRARGEQAGWVPAGADLRAVSLRGEDLRGTALAGAVLDDATLHGADLEGAVLSGARLDRTDLGATRLWDARLDGVTGTDTILEHVDAHRCDFRRCRLTRPRMTLSTFTCCRWTGAALHDAEVGPTLVVGSEPAERAPRPPPPRVTPIRVTWGAEGLHDPAWSPDEGRIAMSRLPGTVLLVDATTGAVRRSLEQPDRSVRSVCWSPDGEALATVGYHDAAVQVWSTRSGELRLVLGGHDESVGDAAWPPDARWLASVASGGEILDARPQWPARSPRGDRVVTSSARFDGHLSLWDVRDGSLRLAIPQRGPAHDLGIRWSADGESFATIDPNEGRIELRHADDGELLSTLVEPRGAATLVTWTPDGRRLLTAQGSGTIRWWDMHRGALLRALTVPPSFAGAWAASPDGRWLACDDGQRLTIHDAEDGALRATPPRLEGRFARLAWSPDGRRLACRTATELRLWDVEAEAWLDPLLQVPASRGGGRPADPFAWSPDGRRIAAVAGPRDVVLDVERCTPVLELAPAGTFIHDLVWSPDGAWLAGAGHGNASPIWSTRDGSVVRVLDHPLEVCEIVMHVAWAPHGRALATASVSGNVWIWSADDGACTLALRLGMGVTRVVWSPDGTRIATNGPTVRIWDATTGARVAELHADGDAWMVSVAGGGFQRGPARPRVMLEVEQPHGHAYLPAAGILEQPTPELVATVLAGRTPGSLAEAQGWPPAEPWDGRVHRMDWVDEPDEA